MYSSSELLETIDGFPVYIYERKDSLSIMVEETKIHFKRVNDSLVFYGLAFGNYYYLTKLEEIKQIIEKLLTMEVVIFDEYANKYLCSIHEHLFEYSGVWTSDIKEAKYFNTEEEAICFIRNKHIGGVPFCTESVRCYINV